MVLYSGLYWSEYDQLTWYNSLWLWRWLPHRLSKRQSLSTTTVLFRTTITRTIKLNLLLRFNVIKKMDEVSSQPVFSVWGSGSPKLLCAPRVHNGRENPLSYGPAKTQLQSLISFSCFYYVTQWILGGFPWRPTASVASRRSWIPFHR